MLTQSISKNSLVLGVFAIITAGLLALTYKATAPKIAIEEKKAAQKALLEIVPRSRHDNDMLADTFPISESLSQTLNIPADEPIHLAKKNSKLVAIILPSLTPEGYSGDIKFIIGINVDGSIAGVRTLSHKETPGLGDKVDINKSNWILGFNGKSLENPLAKLWKVKKDGGEFDQFTGATITPRAMVKQIKLTLEQFDSIKSEIKLAQFGLSQIETTSEKQNEPNTNQEQ